MPGDPSLTVTSLSSAAPLPLVEQITGFVRTRIDERLLRAGTRMPSIRRFAADNSVSRFTVVEAYDRLVAQGYLESRRGSGFYVRERPQPVRHAEPEQSPGTRIDVAWLLRHLYAGSTRPDVLLAGSGCLPAPPCATCSTSCRSSPPRRSTATSRCGARCSSRA